MKSEFNDEPSNEYLEYFENYAHASDISIEDKIHFIKEIFKVINIGICVTNEQGEYVLLNDIYCKIYGYTREELIGKKFTVILPEETREIGISQYNDFMKGIMRDKKEWKAVKKNGELIDVLVKVALLIDKDGSKYRVTSIEDITDIKATQYKLNLISQAVESSTEGIIFTKDNSGDIIDANAAYCKITGYSLSDLRNGDGNILRAGIIGKMFYHKLWESLVTQGFWQGEINGQRKNNEVYTASLVVVAIKSGAENVTNYVGIINETTSLKKNEKKIQFLSTHSIITNLPRRHVFEANLKNEIKKIENSQECLIVFYLNIDGFKYINNNYGFEFGDKLLRAFGQRLRNILGSEASLGYLGVDQFGAFFYYSSSEELMKELFCTIHKKMSCQYNIEKNILNITCSMGISIFKYGDLRCEELLRNAEEAMMEAKQSGKNCFKIYTEEMNQLVIKRRMLQADMLSSIKNNEFFLVYQPQIELTSENIIGVEALLRWRHPTLGIVSPLEFIPIAEETGNINELGEWVLKEACKQLAEWQAMGMNIVVAVNVSAQQLKRDNFIERVHNIIREFKIIPGSLEFELTESSIIDDFTKCNERLLKLNFMGIGVSVDDFGTGYSSLNYLRKLPIYKLKIDKSFIADLLEDDDSKVVTKTIIDMAHNLRYKVIAEGVENKEQIDFLKSYGCDEVQGYFFSKPILPSELERLWIDKTKK